MKAERESESASSKWLLHTDRKWSQAEPLSAAVYPAAVGALFLDQFQIFAQNGCY